MDTLILRVLPAHQINGIFYIVVFVVAAIAP
jgi:hypothetical protein